MSGGFNDPIVGGGGALVYPSIHSPNFVTGVSGWTVNKDGSVEFTNGTFRGQIIGGSLFLYNGAPAKGSLFLSLAVAAGTDAFGNNYGQGLNIGAWSASTGNQIQHFGIDDQGRVYIVGPDDVIRIQINNGSGGTGPDIRFFNDFGAVIMAVDPSRGGVFQYLDNNSAAQGALIGYSGGKNTSDPVNGTAVTAGINLLDPVFGDSIAILGANISLIQVGFTKNALDTANTGSTNQGPFRHVGAPEQTQAGHAVQRWYGTSPDGTRAAGTVISTTDPPARQTPSLLEVQGDIDLAEIAAPAAVAAGPRLFASTASGMLRFVSDTTKGDSNVYDTGWTRLTLAADLPIMGIAMQNVLTFAKVAAIQYRIHAVLWITTSAVAGAAALQLASTGTASAAAVDYQNRPFSGGGMVNTGILIALAAANNSQMFSNQEQVIVLDGTITMSAAGNLGVQMARTAAADAFTVKAQSFIEISPAG